MKFACRLSLLALALCVSGAVADEVPLERVPGVYDGRRVADEQIALQQSLVAAERGAVVRGFVVEPDAQRLADAPEDTGRMLVGVTADIGAAVRFERFDANRPAGRRGQSMRPFAGGAIDADRSGFAWFTAVRSIGATATRLELVDVNLPEGVELYVYNEAGEAFGPLTARDVTEDGTLWSPTVRGEEIRLQAAYSGSDVKQVLAATSFDISRVVHLGPKFFLGIVEPDADDRAFCSFNASCVQNANCTSQPSAIASARDAIAHIQYVVGSSAYICSGGLINDTDAGSTIPYFLTANHCFSSQSSASSLEAYFQFDTPCGGSCYNPDGAVPRINGSTLLSTSGTSDYTFVQLNSGPPAGSTLLGWTTSAVANSNGTNLYRISHPKGAPQAYSTQSVDTSAGTCSGIPRGNWIYSRDTYGATEGGSSGSPVMNSSGQVVGQLTGACGTQTSNPCNSSANATIDGALAAYYNSISQWLDPQTGNCHSGAIGGASYCSASCPCEDGEGDCDSNAECVAGTTCVSNVGPNYGWASWVDVCETANCHSGANGNANYCSNSCTCAAGEGDCDSDAQCDPGLECVDNVGPDYGFASWVDMCEEPAQSNPNSCVGNCGSQAPGGCWCDSACASYGDCCSDKVAVCG